jgi:phage regulator Rha-like protein
MLDETKLRRRIEEFIQTVAQPAYDSVIEKLIKKANTNQIEVAHYPGSETSKARAEKHGGYIMFIKGKTPSGNRKELIYDIMHEMGHCLDEIKLAKEDEQNKPLVMARELRAWQFADAEFAAHSEFRNDVLEYNNYKNQCILSYQKWLDE